MSRVAECTQPLDAPWSSLVKGINTDLSDRLHTFNRVTLVTLTKYFRNLQFGF